MTVKDMLQSDGASNRALRYRTFAVQWEHLAKITQNRQLSEHYRALATHYNAAAEAEWEQGTDELRH